MRVGDGLKEFHEEAIDDWFVRWNSQGKRIIINHGKKRLVFYRGPLNWIGKVEI